MGGPSGQGERSLCTEKKDPAENKREREESFGCVKARADRSPIWFLGCCPQGHGEPSITATEKA